MADHVIRYVVTYVQQDGLRTLLQPAQGRYTYQTPEDAGRYLCALLQHTSRERLAQVYGAQALDSFQVRPVECWPVHHDPVRVYFDNGCTSCGGRGYHSATTGEGAEETEPCDACAEGRARREREREVR